MSERTSRTEMLIGSDAVDLLRTKRVAVFGIGGVGGYAAEALARAGVGTIDLIDSDTVAESNLNRQIIALTSTLGRPKSEVMAERIHDIDPGIKVNARQMFFLPETEDQIDFREFDYVLDAIDTVTGKIRLIECCREAGVPVISAMGAGNKLDPSAFRVADIYDTKVCPLAKVMRKELKKRGIEHLKVVYSEEPPLKGDAEAGTELKASGRPAPGSISFVPGVCGLIMVGAVIKDLAGIGR
ncbi:MAG: tRNA threonylcarbamoyladenosine dehydratase [Lachnospiraceae bacterium]|nr:tRNA threonylcarbamoyladenosine dehydratase [Lachnospiraceae bacterium]